MTRFPGRIPPPVPADRICECSLCRKARGLEPLSEAELRRRRIEKGVPTLEHLRASSGGGQ